MNALVFGAGNIGRGFLGALLGKGGFAVTFVDVDAAKVALINNERAYPVLVVSSSSMREEVVTNVRAISFADAEALTKAIVDADVLLTAVGKSALSAVAEVLARGLTERLKVRPRSEVHVVVVACENVNDNTAYLRELTLAKAPEELRQEIGALISFPNCVVDRIVPNALPANASSSPLAVAVEDYFQFAVDGTALKAPLPAIPGVEVSTDLGATLEQKLFTLNMAHAIVGYYGYLRGYQFIHEAVADSDIRALLRGAFDEVAATLTGRHTNITRERQDAYAAKVVGRFQNAHLRDDIVRVARQPKRKLGPGDRLVQPALRTLEQGRIPAYLTTGITAALHFDYAGDAQSQELVAAIRAQGIDRVLAEISGLAPDSELARLVKADFLLRAL